MAQIKITDMAEGEGGGSRFDYGYFVNVGWKVELDMEDIKLDFHIGYDAMEPGDVLKLVITQQDENGTIYGTSEHRLPLGTEGDRWLQDHFNEADERVWTFYDGGIEGLYAHVTETEDGFRWDVGFAGPAPPDVDASQAGGLSDSLKYAQDHAELDYHNIRG